MTSAKKGEIERGGRMMIRLKREQKTCTHNDVMIDKQKKERKRTKTADGKIH